MSDAIDLKFKQLDEKNAAQLKEQNEKFTKIEKELEAERAKLSLNTQLDILRGNLNRIDVYAQINMYALYQAYDNYEKVLTKAKRNREARTDPALAIALLSWAIPFVGGLALNKVSKAGGAYLAKKALGDLDAYAETPDYKAREKFGEAVAKKAGDLAKWVTGKGVKMNLAVEVDARDKLNFDKSKAALAIQEIAVVAALEKAQILDYIENLQLAIVDEKDFSRRQAEEAVQRVRALPAYGEMVENGATVLKGNWREFANLLAIELEKGLWLKWLRSTDVAYWSTAYISLLQNFQQVGPDNSNAMQYVLDLQDLQPIFDRVDTDLAIFVREGNLPFASLYGGNRFKVNVTVQANQFVQEPGGGHYAIKTLFRGTLPDIRWYRTVSRSRLAGLSKPG